MSFKRPLKIFSITGLTVALLFLIYVGVFFGKAPPNTYFANLSIAGRNEEKTQELVKNFSDVQKQRKIVVKVASKRLEFLPSEVGFDLDSRSSLEKVQAVAKADNLAADIKNKFSALFVRVNIEPVYNFDSAKLDRALDLGLAGFEKRAVDATIITRGTAVEIAADRGGVVVDRVKLVSDVAGKLNDLSQEPIVAEYIVDEPKVLTENAKRAQEKIRKLNEQNITLSYEFDTWRLSGQTLSDLLTFYARGQGQDSHTFKTFSKNPLIVESIDLGGKGGLELDVKLDDEKLSNFIVEIASVVDVPTVDATLEFDGVKVSAFTPAQDGRALNRESTRKLILDTISIDNESTEKNVAIKLPVELTSAKIANERINSLGIRELVGSGVSYFAGSIPNRAFNIGLGSQLINGTLVAPGESFSFTKLVGPVSSEQGFRQAYVISRGRTVLDDGGGICQVSTTVFRAALNAGLPILGRTAHAYRVAYYEQKGFKPGFDATIFSPSVDLKFKNDTANHLLVQTIVDNSQAKVRVDIYGTSDGRRVEISEPLLSSHKAAPEPLYQDDPTLPKGTKKQVDFAADGLTSVFTRKVYKGAELIIDDTFKSVFRPWQAVYLVGTGG